jgi:hypothetical protein
VALLLLICPAAELFKAADQFEVLAESGLDEPVVATPALVGDHLYFRTAGHQWRIGSSDAAVVRTDAAAESNRPKATNKASAIK